MVRRASNIEMPGSSSAERKALIKAFMCKGLMSSTRIPMVGYIPILGLIDKT
jgi:hypothetical protein